MKHKVIVADDSLTIQKVIKITLAKEDFELIECMDDSKLYDLCKEVKPTLVLLDFNLSESKTGYDLCREMKNSDVDKVLMLYGTFDTVDEDLLDHCGANGYIVKPFEGNKFVSQVRQLIEDASENEEVAAVVSESAPEAEAIEEPVDQSEDLDIDEGWVVNQPTSDDITSPEDKTDEFEMSELASSEDTTVPNDLEKAASDWGVDVPGVISEAESKNLELPPVIGSSVDEDATGSHEIQFDAEEDESNLPNDTELEYPNVEEIKESVKNEPQLTSLDELHTEEPVIEYSIDDTAGTKTDDEVRALEEQIANETSEDLWTVDDEDELPAESDDSEEEVELSFIDDEVNTSPEAVAPMQEGMAMPELSKEEVLEALNHKIEEIVNARVEAIIEKVAWEVIPDLAENLISKELKSLADSAKE